MLTQSDGTRLAAHRGGALLWPENSLLAFRNAIALGADFLELDVHLSRDGEVVVIHDATLPRTTTGVGAVHDLRLAQLRALSLKDKDGRVTDEAIPSLDDVARLAGPTPLGFLLELKVDERRARYPGIEEKVFAILDRHGLTMRAVVMSFEPETVRRVRELRPEVRAGALYSPRTLKERRLSVGSAIDELWSCGGAFVGLQHSLVSAESLASARARGLLLGAWTVNEADSMRRLIDLGVGVLITDRPDLAKKLLNR
jgi:glycerophosphoryl diester phosphodiesterase